MKIFFTLIILTLFLFNLGSVYAHGEETFAQANEIIEQKISCDVLTDNQLEVLGEYYMEQMHPGEAHELMDKMMGGNDSESLREMHINMAKMLYCNEDVNGMMSSGGMMGMMSMMNSEMMGGNMMGSGGMMGRLGSGFSYWNFISVLYIILLIGLIILIILLIIKLLKSIDNKKGRKQ